MKHLFILVALASFISLSQQCRVNEVYKECGGCDQYCNEEPVACEAKLDCSGAGCYCEDEYVRAFRGPVNICIPRSECAAPQEQSSSLVENTGQHQQCDVNEEYTCGCEQYCGEPMIFCFTCTDGCFCKGGFKRSFRGGVCIPINTCVYSQDQSSSLTQNTGPVPPPAEPPAVENTGYQCGDNEVYQQCGVGLQCQDYCGRGDVCAYCEPGCYCKPGYIRDGPEYDAQCIPEDQCAQYYCSDNEVYNSCGGCDQYCNEEPIACAADCSRPGCYCEEGYLRAYQGGGCIPSSDCPVPPPAEPPAVENTGYQCGDYEVYQQCGVGWQCEDYCGRGANACAYCEPGCYCIRGYIREGPGYYAACIPEGQCPGAQDVSVGASEATMCGANEVYQQCGVGVECEDYCGRGVIACAYCKPGCYCSPGYKRDGPEYDAVCIPENMC